MSTNSNETLGFGTQPNMFRSTPGRSHHRYKITEHGPFLLGTVNYPDGSTGYCSVYVKDEDTLIVGDTKFTRSK